MSYTLLLFVPFAANQLRLVRGLQLATLARLQTLELRGNRLESVDAECLYALPSLKHLFLAQNQIARVDMLARLENLTTLHLRENAIEKLDSFSAPGSGADLLAGGAMTGAAAANAAVGFKKLEYLNMRANRITILKEVSKLKRLPAIKAIVMSGNTRSTSITSTFFVCKSTLHIAVLYIQSNTGQMSHEAMTLQRIRSPRSRTTAWRC